jgi:hypothetical protein
VSFDLYLLPASAVGLDPERARAFLDREERNWAAIPDTVDPACEHRKRQLADLLLGMKPSFQAFHFDFDAIAAFEKISADEARRKYRHIEMNGPDDTAEAQFLVFDRYVLIHWYSGTTSDEMDALLTALSLQGELVVYDPQTARILDLREGPLT